MRIDIILLALAVISTSAACSSSSDPGDGTPDATELEADSAAAEVIDANADSPESVDFSPGEVTKDIPPEIVSCDDPDPGVCPQNLAWLCDGLSPTETAEEASISYYLPGSTLYLDLGVMGGYWQEGDVEASCFDPLHPFVLRSIRLYLSEAGQAEVHLWPDYGGGWPDRSKELAGPFIVDVSEEGWVEVEVPGGLELHPYERVWVGFVHGDSDMTVAVDEGDPFLQDPNTETWAMTNHSKVWSKWYKEQMESQGGFQWLSSPYTHLMELNGQYICHHEERQFAEISEETLGEEVYATRMSWSDIDGDGFDDFMVHNTRYPGEPKERLFRNDGAGGFEEWSGDAGLVGKGSNLVTFADVDNDGDQDALLSVYYNLENNPDPAWEDALLLNDGAGHFVEKADAGLANGRTTATGAFADYDADGNLDFFAGNTRHHGEGEHYDQAMQDQLFRGIGAGTFSDVTDAAGIAYQPSSMYPFNPDYFTLTNGCLWTDYDGDGDQDLYVANYGLAANFMWENLGDGTFEEVAQARNLHADDRDGEWADGTSFGVHWADYDNDGDMDMFQTEISHPRYHDWGSDKSSLRRNPGGTDPVFEIVTEEVGIVWDEGDYEASFVDFDNDGLLDLFISSVYGLHYSRLYRQNPDHTFTDWTYLAGVRVMNAKSHAWADFDRDGDQDLLVGSRQPGVHMRLFRNDLGQDNAWLTVRLQGVTDARDGIGARVEVTTPDGVTRTREVRAGGGRTRQDSLAVEFGLGDEAGPVTLTVTWPGGSVDTWQNVEVRSFALAVQGEADVEYR